MSGTAEFMQNSKKTLFISDIHLICEREDITRHFLLLLENCNHQIDSLYILGDLFELWIGDDLKTPFISQITDSLMRVSQRGINIYLMRGNRDFLLGNQFATKAGATLLNDVEIVTIYQQKALLLHGDLLCTDDLNYQKSRRLMRNRFLQKLFLSLPLSIRERIANRIRKSSEQHMHGLPLYFMDVNQATFFDYMKKYDCELMIHGHTHQPNIHKVTYDNKLLTRIVLSSWDHDPRILVWGNDGSKKLMTINELIAGES